MYFICGACCMQVLGKPSCSSFHPHILKHVRQGRNMVANVCAVHRTCAHINIWTLSRVSKPFYVSTVLLVAREQSLDVWVVDQGRDKVAEAALRPSRRQRPAAASTPPPTLCRRCTVAHSHTRTDTASTALYRPESRV